MGNIVLLVAILAVLIVLTNLFPREKKQTGGNCRKCPEFQYCGGGRSHCSRRSERK